MTAPIIKTQILGSDFASALNDASLQALVDDVIAAARTGDEGLGVLINNLRVDARAWFQEAMSAASTLESGLQRTQIEAIVDQLRPWIGGRTAIVNGEVQTLESAMQMLISAPEPETEHFVFGPDRLPAAINVTFVGGRQAIMTAANADDGAGVLTCTFSTPDYYLGAPGSFTQRYAYSTRNVLGKDRKHGYVMVERTRVAFDVSRFLVSGQVFNGLDLDSNGTTDGSIPAAEPAPDPAPVAEEPVTTDPAPAPAPTAEEPVAAEPATTDTSTGSGTDTPIPN